MESLQGVAVILPNKMDKPLSFEIILLLSFRWEGLWTAPPHGQP